MKCVCVLHYFSEWSIQTKLNMQQLDLETKRITVSVPKQMYHLLYMQQFIYAKSA